MDNIQIAQYESFRRVTTPETFNILREIVNCPGIPSGRDLMYEFYKSKGIDVDYDEIFADE